MKLSRVIMLLVLMGILGMATHFSIDTDVWWHLKAGEWMVEHKAIIQEDPFSLTRGGTPWQYPGVAVQVLMYLTYDWFGPGALNLLTSILVTVVFLIVWRMCEGNEMLVAALVILGALASAIYWNARPYLLTFLIFALMYYLLDKYYRKKQGKLWLLPVLMVVWVNSHGGFLAGFILVAPYLVDSFFFWLASLRDDQTLAPMAKERLVHLVLVTVLMLVGSVITPQGPNLWALPFTTVSRQAEQLLINEWQSPNFHDASMYPFAALLFMSLAVLGGRKERTPLHEILLLSGFGLLGLISMRNIFFFSIIAPPIYSRYLGQIFEWISGKYNINARVNFNTPPTRISGAVNAGFVIIVGLVVVFQISKFLPESANMEDFKERYPVAAVEYLKGVKPEGNMFNSYNYGGYLIWALEEYPVFVDGRADLYGDEIILPVYRILTGSDEWEEVFAEWEIGFVVVEPEFYLVSNLEKAGWVTIYKDDLAAILTAPQ